MNPYLFLVGCLRSGTTLLQRVVDAHPDIAVILETQWVARWYEHRVGVAGSGAITRELVDRVVAHPRFGRLEVDPAVVVALGARRPPLQYAEFVARLFDLHGRQKGKKLVGEKSPGYVRHLPTLHELWPEARIVHLIRDGRDVCLSVLDWKKAPNTVGRFSTWEEDAVITTALWWEWHVRLGRQGGQGLSATVYYEMRYEALVADPSHESSRLCSFLGVDPNPEMLRFHEGRTRKARTTKGAWLPVTAGLRNWRDAMPLESVQRFEAAAGSLLDELGLERAAPKLDDEHLERASRLRSAFIDELRARGRPIPDSWLPVAA